MAYINENYLKLPGNYLFAEVARRVAAYKDAHPGADIIRLGIGDVTLPLPAASIAAMHAAVDEMAKKETFRGYGPEQGYDFLIDAIIERNYTSRGIKVAQDEIFVSDGSKSDCGNIQEIFSTDDVIAITDPVYPVYLDTNVMAGRTGALGADGRFAGVAYLPSTEDNNFAPALPDRPVDMIYLCCPNNPTGTTLSRDELKKWVNYARENEAVILFDAAYAAYITEPDVPRSIYEIDGAQDVAIEFRSFSKTAGFTGTRCGYTVIPKALTRGGQNLNAMWVRNRTTKTNGVSYLVQKAAAAVFTERGQREIREILHIYKENARRVMEALDRAGQRYYGGKNAPYIWMACPDGEKSWDFFDRLLRETGIVATPGAGFGACGEGFMRFSTFGDPASVREASALLEAFLKRG
jgi:LL-diaminopimelate aminotransferase